MCFVSFLNFIEKLTIRKVLPAVMQFFEEMILQDSPDSSAGDAMILLKSINFKFLLCLEIICPIFQVTATASDALQQKDIDLAAYKTVDGALQWLAYSRTEEEFEKMYERETEKAPFVGLDLPSEVPGQARRRKVPAKFKFAATTTTDDHALACTTFLLKQ